MDVAVREKYLLRELPDETVKSMIISAITATEQASKMEAYEKLTAEVFSQLGGFNVDGFKFKSDVEGAQK